MAMDPIITLHLDTSELDAAITKIDQLITLQQSLRCVRWCPLCALKRWWVRR